MEIVKKIGLGIFYGLWDSVRGMSLLLHIDAEIHRIENEKEQKRQQRLQKQQKENVRRSPSPVPISAAEMQREALEAKLKAQEPQHNPDERHYSSIIQKKAVVKEKKPKRELKVAKKILKCCLLNGGFTWFSIIFFEHVILPLLRFIITICWGEQSQELHIVWEWLTSILPLIFGLMWVLPIFLLSKIVSSLWFADIANAAYRVRKGPPQNFPSISKMVADFLFSLIVQSLFLVQSMLVNLVPVRYLGATLSFIHLCYLYSMYCFEYKWFNMGWELRRRLWYIETNWPYFLGFGIPLTVLTNMTNSLIVSSCIFSIFFPLFILSGNEAKPLVGTTDTPLRLFSPVIHFSNLFFRKSKKPAPKLSAEEAQKEKQQFLLFQEKKTQQNIALQQQFEEYQRHIGLKRDEDDRSSRTSSMTVSTNSSSRPFQFEQAANLQPTQRRSSSKYRSESPAERMWHDSVAHTNAPTRVPGSTQAK